MFNIADWVVIIMILIATVSGYKKGFIKTGFGILSFFIALAITFMFYKPVVKVLREKTGLEEWLSNYLYTIDLEGSLKNQSGDAITTNESGDTYIDKLPEIIVEMIGIEDFKENAKVEIIEKIVDFVLKLFAIIIVYITARIILAIVALILDLIASLPVLKQFNELFGILLGAILGFIQVYMLCAFLTLISSLPIANSIYYIIANSMFAHNLYNNNVLLKILF